MGNRNFREMLEAQWSRGNFVCVGLDSDLEKIPEVHKKGQDTESALCAFNFGIIDRTADVAGFYKPNSAFYEEHGGAGRVALRRTFEYVHRIAPEAVAIWDAKRADIGNTNNGYARTAFDKLGADAITVHPYLGGEALKPFLDRADKGVFVLCRTSNPESDEFQMLPVLVKEKELCDLLDGKDFRETSVACGWIHLSHNDLIVPMYQYVAMRVARHWNKNGNCALVVGATYPKELYIVRELVGDMPILIPSVGFQQKDVPLETQVEQVVAYGQDSRGKGMIINSSRGIIFSDDPRRETQKLHNLVNRYRKGAA